MSATPRIHRFDNGLRLATVAMPHMASVSAGLWTGAGSRHEGEREHGIAHFTEHMLFKGTPTRSAEEISRHIEGLGASIDGFTVEDHTSYQVKGPAERFPRLFEVMADFYRNPSLDPGDIESERNVVCEEIAMVREQPSQYIEDLVSEAAWGADHPLGRPITGTEESIASFQRAGVLDFFRRAYCGSDTVVAVAGKVEHEAVVAAVGDALGDLPEGAQPSCRPASPPRAQLRFEPHDEGEQAHLALAFRSVHRSDPGRYAHKLLNVMLGENMSSRLFQAVRERLGLCYEIQSDLVAFEDAGLAEIHLALGAGSLRPALQAVSEVIAGFREQLVPAAELAEAKAYVTGQSRIALENTSCQMSWAGECLLHFDEWIDPEEAHSRIERVTAAELREAARAVFAPELRSAALIGPERSRPVLEDWLAASAWR